MSSGQTICGGFLLSYCFLANSAPAQEPISPQRPKWIDEVQTYAMVPLLPATAKKTNISVNGIWAGIGSDHAILASAKMVPSVRTKYGADVATFVKDGHDAGLIVCGIINGIEGTESLRQQFPNLETMACCKADGTPARNKKFLLMCTNNPNWIEAEVELGKQSIDAGADVLQLDTPMGSAFLSSGLLKAGYCDHCMSRLEKHLMSTLTGDERKRLGIEPFDRQSIIDRLRTRQELSPKLQPFVNDTPDDQLFRRFIVCQEQSSFDTRRQLVEQLRRYAAEKGRAVAFSTNAADLGTMNPYGHWVRGIMFADLVDFFAYELDVLPQGLPTENLMPLPRGKWAAYHKLAYAIHRRRSPAVIHASQMGKLLMDVMVWRQRTTSSWFGALAAEAYAANGAFVMYQIEAPFGMTSGLQRFWGKTSEVHGFVREHAEFYNGDLRSGSPVAFVMLLNERGRTIPSVFPSYLGFAQALVEGNYPFDVVFGGDGHYVCDRLRLDNLQHYSTVIVPSPIEPTENQKQVIAQFVRTGGTLVTQEPERLGIDVVLTPSDRPYLAAVGRLGKGRVLKLGGEVTPVWTNDIGSEFFKSYGMDNRKHIWDLADMLGLRSVLSGESNGMVGAFPVVQPERGRTVVHLVNYDVDLANDEVREQPSFTINLPLASPPKGELRAELFTSDSKTAFSVAIATVETTVSCTISRLKSNATLVISSN